MNQGTIACNIRSARRLLELCNLFYDTNTRMKFTLLSSKFTVEFKKYSMGDDYLKTYQYAIKNGQYDFLLADRSFIQFSCEEDKGRLIKIRYAYYEVPLMIPTYEDFLSHNGFSYQECGEELYSCYEQELDEARLKKSITPIRYDYDLEEYEKTQYALSHIHIGHENDVRIPISKILSPMAFVAFIIRHSYWKDWKKALKDRDFLELYSITKRECSTLECTFFTAQENADLFIS